MRGNHKTGRSKAESGRMGRGADAYSPREWKKWQDTLKRIEQVVAEARRKQEAGEGVDPMRSTVIVLPIGAEKF